MYLDYAIIMHENLASVKSQSTLLHFFSIHKMLYFTRDISLNTGPNLKAKLEEHSGNFVDYCFFGDDGNGTFLSCRSKNLGKHVSEWAEYLWDSKLLAKLNEADMTATEAKYHRKCLTELYNRVKSKQNDEKSEKKLFTVVEGTEWTVFLSISDCPIFCSIAHSLCFSKTSIHSATHSVSV